ncbi:FAD-dependent oxidoreductase [Parerythrobacter aurantius]|uniref:FAD-dependent oxidoreductase n=1 Tax=Parerythrobacter aurantius TaxID=3127706 RepID=UPI00325619BD
MAMEMTRRQGLLLGAAAGAAGLVAPTRARAGKSGPYDVAVVGAGVFGAWSAAMLARRGLRVALVDQYGPANARASSAGESRVTRLSYGGDTIYSAMALESLAEWQALSDRSALPLLHRTGVLWFSPDADRYMASSIAWLEANGRTFWRGDAAMLRERFPQIRFEDGEAGFVEAETGALMAGRAVQSLIADAGLAVIHAEAGAPQRLSSGSWQVCDGVEAGKVVYACGPWLGKLFPEVLAGRIVPTRQEVLHFGSAAGDDRFKSPALPVWADFNGGEIVYGLPDLEQQGFKIAFDKHGAEVDPDTQDRRVAAETVEAARDYLSRRFPDLASAPLVHSRVCQYENSSNGDFLIDRLPGYDDIWLVGGGSGHGFKHGPAVGRRVADHITDAALPIEPRFSLATKGTVAARSVY